MSLDLNTIYCGDNKPYLEQLVTDKRQFDLVITDPPYNIGKDFGNNTDSLTLEDFLFKLDERLSLLKKILSPRGSIILFCTHLYIGDVQFLLRKYFYQRRMMIWFYENGMSRQIHEPVTEYEPFWWFSNSEENFVYNMDDVRVPYKTDRVRNPVYKLDSQGNKRAWTPDPRGRKRGDVWAYPTLSGKHFEDEKTPHPTQKPMSLITDLIRAFSPKNSSNKYDCRILDPYVGSGTLPACCEKLNKEGEHKIEWIGMELEQMWVDVGNSRIQKERDKYVEKDMFAEE